MNSTDLQSLMSRITRDQGPEFEQTLAFAGLSQVSTPTSLRTDRKIKWIDLHVRGRLTAVAAGIAAIRPGPPLLGTPLFSMIQQVTIRGQHLRYGAQTPLVMSGEMLAEMVALFYPNYVPQFTNSIAGAAPVRGGPLGVAANNTNDFDFVLPIPLFPLDLSPADQVFYCLHGPDWPGNLYIDIACADCTALGCTVLEAANYTAANGGFTAFGAATGVPSIDILTERPLVSKDYMSKIQPAITFRITNNSQPTTAVGVAGVTGAGVKLMDLTVGKDTTRILLKTGTLRAGLSAGLNVFGVLLDTIVTRTFISLDNRALRFQNALADSALQDYRGRSVGRTTPIGYKVIDFISSQGTGAANPKAAFASSKLTAARQFTLNGDVVAAATQIAEVVQEMTLGRPGLAA